MDTKSIPVVHFVLLAMTAIGLKTHVTILPPLLAEAGRDSWMSVLITIIFFLPWSVIFFYLHKKTYPDPFLMWFKKRNSAFIYFLFKWIFILALIIVAVFTMRETIQWINATFLPKTPIFLLLLAYVILCIYLASTNIKTIIITNAIVLFGVIIFGFFVAFTNMQFKDYALLRPFLEHGYTPIIKGTIYPASGIIEILLLLIIQDKFRSNIRFKHYAIILFILVGLTLGPLIGAITEFGPREAASQLFPAFEEWGLVSIGRFIEHVDFLSIYQWLTGAFIRMGLFLYMIVILMDWEKKPKLTWVVLGPIFFLLCILLFFLEDESFFEIKSHLILGATLIGFFILSILLAILVFVNQRKERRKKHEG